MGKDIKRFSFSRLSTFQKCPKKHHYAYVEQIETEETATTIPGKLFHACIEAQATNKDMSPMIEEFKRLCLEGKLELEPDTLEEVVKEYFQYYATDTEQEEVLLVEYAVEDELEEDDKLVMIVDKVYLDRNDYLVVRDTKTTVNRLKYTQDDVTHNAQLLLYVPYVENELNRRVDCIEIDEVRIAKLQPVPILRNGKPTTSKNLLELVTYEAYYEILSEMGLERDREFQPVLDWLSQRGHPLFNRIKVQVLDQNFVATNAQDLLDTYHTCKNGVQYRVTGPLCNYCQYKELCHLDYSHPSEMERDILKQRLSKK
jgi:hypothetical protein